ncbi:MAG: UvrD-helicase domain-containing protein [Clostridiaceae bacterium]|nr:UvrD-helicase domain-containing protein [Clostridiaceae bacterium]
MAVEFTESQKMAIESRGCSLIVSAAAGSGKTAVLVERVIGLICDKEAPCDIDSLIVVTFTNAAAAEMRQKIGSALLKKITEEPNNMRLRRQLTLLSGARIQTVHSFCLDLVKEHFAVCGVSADFSVADESVSADIRKQALDEVLEELYIEGDSDFSSLCKALSEEKGDRILTEAIEEIYDRLISHSDPMGTLYRFTSEDGQRRWKPYLLHEAGELMENAEKRLKAAMCYMVTNAEVNEKYSPAFFDCLSFASGARKAISDGWDNAYCAFSAFQNPKLKAVRGEENKDIAEYMKAAKQSFVEAVGYIRDKIFVMTDEESQFGSDVNLSALRGLRIAEERYLMRFSELKLERKLLDFSDLEHYALKLLRTDEGNPTELALEISAGINEILVDEYQDTNDIQDAIFSSLGQKSGGFFYVGDVKQSIYRFRMAKPEIFMEKYLSYGDFNKNARGEKLKLSLNRNFRSRREILETCNHVFSAIMSREFGDIDYTSDEALYNGAPYDGEKKVHFEIIDMQGASDDDNSPEKAEAEAIYTACEIARMLETEQVTNPFTGESRKARYSDFAIILSSFTNKSGYFIKELERIGIPVSGGRKDFWGSMEILVMMAFLRVLDNRRQDIPLVGLLRSPFFLFTADELAEIRLEKKEAYLYDAIMMHASHGDKKSSDFCSMIDRYISYVPDMSASQLIRMIYSELSAMAVFGAMDRGEDRRRKLQSFYELALKYESSGHRSVFDFIRYAEGLMETDSAPGIDESDGVRIMSIHKSKGLEFPFVFIPDLNKTFNFDDLKKPIIIHDRLGIGMKIRIRKTRAEYRMPMHMAVAAATRRELASEEMRKLYVAMTRAKERLILVAGIRNASKTLEDIGRDIELGGITPVWLSQKNNAAAWLIAAFKERKCQYITQSVSPYTSIERIEQETHKEDKTHVSVPDRILLSKLEHSNEEYPYAAVSRLPSKLTPAGTRRLIEEDSGIVDTKDDRVVIDIYHHASGISTGLTAAQRGSAIHLFLQHADFKKCRSEAEIRRQIESMTDKGLMTMEEADTLDMGMILGFAEGQWGKRASKCERLLREYEFSAMLTPKEIGVGDMDDEEILMNGIIDLMLFEDGGITIIDFKSDSVISGHEAEAAVRHKLQLDIYAMAAQKIFKMPVKEKIVFLLKSAVGQPV